MSTRLIAAVLVAALALLLAVLLAPSGGGPAAESFAGAARPPGIPPQDFVLRDERGQRVRLSDYAGHATILAFLDSTRPRTSALIAQQIRGTLDLGRGTPAIAVSIDPRDTPASARRFLAAQSLLGRMHFLLGSRARLEPIWRAFGVVPSTSRANATASVILIDKAGRQRIGYAESELTPEALAHDVAVLAAEPAPTPPPPREQL